MKSFKNVFEDSQDLLQDSQGMAKSVDPDQTEEALHHLSECFG